MIMAHQILWDSVSRSLNARNELSLIVSHSCFGFSGSYNYNELNTAVISSNAVSGLILQIKKKFLYCMRYCDLLSGNKKWIIPTVNLLVCDVIESSW